MKLTKVLLVLVLVVCWKDVNSKEIGTSVENIDVNSKEIGTSGENIDVNSKEIGTSGELLEQNALAETHNEIRGLKDVWIKIKESAIASWNYIKELATTTTKKLGKYIEDVKKYAEEVKVSLNEHLDILKKRIDAIIEDIYGTRELVKQCVLKEKEKIDELLTGIQKRMEHCISDQIKQILPFGNKQADDLYDPQYIDNLENKFEACESSENVEECMNLVRNDVLDDVSETEDKILKTNTETRGIVDDVKNTIVSCSVSNIIDASYYISLEVMDIAKCVLESNSTVEAKPLEGIKTRGLK